MAALPPVFGSAIGISTTSPTKMKLHTYAGNVHALQSLIVARYNGVEIELPPFEMGKDNKTKAFLAKSPMGEPEPEASP